MDQSHLCMSYSSFVECILQMKTLSGELNDNWTVQEKPHSLNGTYLSKTVRKTSCKTLAPDNITENLEEDLTLRTEDDSRSENTVSLPDDGNDDTFTFEYHVAFNISYSCPVLCFNAWKTNGSLLSLEECWRLLGLSDSEYKYSALTQMDHPVCMRPFLTLHPCKTNELIGTTLENSRNPVVSWLSAVGPVAGLSLAPEYAKLTF